MYAYKLKIFEHVFYRSKQGNYLNFIFLEATPGIAAAHKFLDASAATEVDRKIFDSGSKDSNSPVKA